MNKPAYIALAGQPNTGKSTLFNALTGARQHVANYPGITVEKKTGRYTYNQNKIEIVDLPGTYSLTAYTPEEMVTRHYILSGEPEAVVNIVDTVNLERQLILTFQLLEMEKPLLIYANKKDAAEKRGLNLHPEILAEKLGAPVVYGTARKGENAQLLKEQIEEIRQKRAVSPWHLNYGDKIEAAITSLEEFLKPQAERIPSYPVRWTALKLLENDAEIIQLVSDRLENSRLIQNLVDEHNAAYAEEHGYSMEVGISLARSNAALQLKEQCVTDAGKAEETLTDKIDKVVLHRLAGPFILLGVMYAFYWITMVGGQKLTDLIFPWFQVFRNFISGLIPAHSLFNDGFLRSLLLNGIVDGVVMILNYLPIFYVLYLVIAFMEDSGYMARIAFIMDRLLRSFGLHGQSTLPMLLGGAIVGGCAVPGITATRTIRDKKARLVTILVIPLMNCMAKVPFYVLMTGIFFKSHQPLVLWSFSVSTLIVALLVAKLLSTFVVKGEPEPFVLELPSYQMPTLKGVFIRGTERLWLFIKKVATIVVAVSVLIWFGVTFPQKEPAVKDSYEQKYQNAVAAFMKTAGSDYGEYFASPEDLVRMARFEDNYKIYKRQIDFTDETALRELNIRFAGKNPVYTKILMKGKTKLGEEEAEAFQKYWRDYKADQKALKAGTSRKSAEELAAEYQDRNPYFFDLVKSGKIAFKKGTVVDKRAAVVSKGWAKLRRSAELLKRDLAKETLNGSVLGMMGRFLEPVSSLAGMDWRINIAIIGSFAAKEALVSTLGTIYSLEAGDEASETPALQDGLARTGVFRPLHALAIMVFIALFPPCIATMILIKLETGSWKWLIFAIIYPIILGFLAAALVFQTGLLLGF